MFPSWFLPSSQPQTSWFSFSDLELNPKSKNEIVSLLKCIPPFLISFSNFQSAKKTFDESEAPKPKPANQKRKNKRNKKK